MSARLHRGLLLVLGAIGASTVAVAACSYDFHAFDPISDGTGGADATLDQSAHPGDGGTDDGDGSPPACSTPTDPTCLNDAIGCSSDCTSAENDCISKCGNVLPPPNCKPDCTDAGTKCKDKCRTTCNQCTRQAGCEDPIKCRDAVEGHDGG